MAKKIENIVNEVVRTSEKVAQQSVKKARTNAQRKKQSAKSRTRSSSSGGIKDNAIIRRIGDTRQGTQNFLKNAIEETADSARRMMAVKSDDLVKAYNEKVNFSASDGTTFGPIRRGIYAKLVNFADDSKFDFESEEERNAVEAYKKYPGIDFELGGKNYKVTYNGYKAIANNTWDKYKPEESEKDAFNAIKSYPIYDLVTKDEKGNDKNWGKISYNGMQSLQNKKEYSSAFEDETKTINSYNTATGNIPAKSYDEIYEAAKYRIIEKAKANPSAQFEINPMSGNEDLAYYYQFITPSEREKIWQEFDEEFQKSVKTTSERNQYKALLKEREQALTSEYSDTKNTKKKNDEISTLVNTLTKTEGNFDKGFKTTLKVNQIEKILKEGEKINSEYKKIADKSNANDKYAPKNNSENKGYNLESKNRDEVYNMINLYSAGKLNEVNSFSINGIDVKKAWMYMEPAEISTYNKLYATDPKMAEKYLDELDDVLRIRMSNAIATQAREEGKKHPFLAAGLSLVGNMQNSGESALDTFVADITGDTAGYSDASIALRQAQNWRAGGAEKVTEKYGKAAGWAYNTGLSITENAITIAVTKGVGTAAGLSGKTIGAATTLSMATNAASNEMISIADRGGTARQMTMGGIAAGLFEYLFEKVPVDKIVSIRGGSVVKNMLGSALAEIPSEMGTEVANIISDSIIMGTNSKNSLRRQRLVAEGMSAEEATKQVLRENLDQVLQAGASGGVSGGVMGGGATIINNATYNGEMKPIAEEIISTPKAIDKVIKLGEDLGVTEAKVVSEAVAKGETPTTKQVRKLTDAVVKKSIEKDASLPNIIKTIATIEGRKSDYYTSQEAIDTARAVYRTVAGTATETDKTLVARSDGARAIILASANTIGIDGEDSKEVTAWTALKTEAEKRMRSLTSPRAENAFPTEPENLEMRSENPETSGVKYKIAHTTENKPVVVIENDILDGVDKKDWVRTAKDAIKKFRPEIPISGRFVKVTKDTGREYTNSRYTKHIKNSDRVKYRDKLTASGNLDEIVIASTQYVNEGLNHPRNDDIKNFARGNVLLEVGGRQYSAEVIIGTKSNGEMLLHDVINLDAQKFDIKKKTNPKPDTSDARFTSREDSSSTDSISKDKATVNSKDMQNVEKDARVEKKVPSPEEAKKAENVDNGIVVTEESKQLKKENFKAYNNIGKLATSLKTRAVVVRGLKNSKGEVLAGQLNGGVIYVNADVGADKISRWAALHEASHLIKQKAAKIWQRFENYAIKRLEDTGEYKVKYELKKDDYKAAEINEELACDYIGDLFESEAELTEFIRTDKSLAVKVRDFFYNALSRWGLFGERKKAQALWLKAYQAAMKNDVKSQINKKSVSGTRVSEESTDGSFDEEYEDFSNHPAIAGSNTGGVSFMNILSEETKVKAEAVRKERKTSVKASNAVGKKSSSTAGKTENKVESKQTHSRFMTAPNLEQETPSDRSTDTVENLREENARLREELENIHLQLSQAEGKGLDTKAIKKAAKDIKRAYYSKIKTSELHKDLVKLYSDMANNKLDGDEIGERIRAIADKVIAEATETIEYSEYGDLLKTIRNTKIAVPEDDKASFADGFSQFKNSNRGKLNLNDDGYPLDALWDDLCSDYPQLFSEDTRGSEERLNRLLEVRNEFSPYEKAVFGSTESVQKARYALENDIMESFYKIPEGGDGKYVFYDTRASQAQKELQQAKEKYEKLLERTVKKLEGKIEKTELAYEHEINRIEERHERELDKKNKEIEKAEEKNEKLRDRYDREKIKKGIDRYFNYLFKMYSDPTDARHIPEALRRDVGNILERINFETKHTDKLKEKGEESALSIRLEGIAEVFRRIQSEAWGVISTDDSPTIDAALRQDLEELISEIPVDESGNSKRLEDMTTEELKAVYEMLMAVHHAVTKSNKAFSDSIKGNINENAEKVDREMENVRSKRKGSGEKIKGEGNKIRAAYNSLDKFVNADLYKPWDFFHKLGGTMEKLYMATRTAFDNYLKNLQTFNKKLDEATKKINVKKLEKVKTIKLLGGAEIKLTKGQMIGIVATYRRPAGRTHILEGGIVTNRPWKDENGHKRTGVAPIKLNEHDVGVITELLTSEEKNMMEKLVDFMSKECSKWGNETSVKLLGYEKYGEGWYYPIKVWDGSLDKSAAKKGEKNLTNKSFTKKLAPNAGNAIEINDFLDVVMDHVNSMNMYSTVALPLLDMERILNHKGEGTASKDVREAIRRTYGKSAEEYIYKWIRSVNGTAQKVERDFLDKLIANTKKAQIAFKLSVFFKQGTSVVRVMQVMNPVHLRSALKSYVQPRKTIREMQENVPIAFWKSLGFRDPAMGTGIKNALLGTESVTDKLGFGLYGLADDFTWGIIYNAVKTEVKSKNKGIDVNSKEFKQKVVERFNYIIDRTQVVDSPFHSAQIMKSNNPLTKLTTSYMSEPLTTLNLYRTDLRDATNEAIEKGSSRYIMGKYIRSTNTFLLSSFLLAIAGALPKMLKEDPEDKYDDDGKKIKAWDRFKGYVDENFADESNPLNLIPYLNKVVDIYEGWEQKDWSFESIEDVVNSAKNLITDDGKTKGWYVKIRDFSFAIAVLFGQPYGNAVKEAEGIAKTVMHMAMGEYGDYLITKSKWNIKDPKNKNKFIKHYENAIINGNAETAAEIFSDYYGAENSEAVQKWCEETARLYKATKDDKVLYNAPEGKFKFGGKEIKLEGKKYNEYIKEVNKNYIGDVEKVLKSNYYKKLPDKEKIKMLSTLRTRAENETEMKYYPVNVLDNDKSDEVLAELDKLYMNTGENMLAQLPKSSFSADGEEINLAGKEYEKYVDESYDNLWKLAYEFVESDAYKDLTYEEKVKGIKSAWTLAQAMEKYEIDNDYKLSEWQAEVYGGEESFANSFIQNLNEGYFKEAKKEWRKQNFNFDENEYSEAEISSMNEFEESAAAFYMSHEMGISYDEGKYRSVQVYHDYLSDDMTIEEYASIMAYARKVAALSDGKDSMTKKELMATLDNTGYSREVKGALFEGIANKGWKNPYSGGKKGDGTRFPVLTTPPEDGEKEELLLNSKESEKTIPKDENGKTEDKAEDKNNEPVTVNRAPKKYGKKKSGNKKPSARTYTTTDTSNSVKTPHPQTKVTVKYNPNNYTTKQVSRFKQVELDANSYYNSPRLESYSGSSLRHMNVYETRLKSYIDIDTYARIRAEVFGDKDSVTANELQTYIDNLDYNTEVKEALFEAIGEEGWENPYEE